MKILYSDLKKFIRKLPDVSAQEIGHIFTMSGFMTSLLEEVTYRGKKDYLYDLEVRQNRADCLSVFGLAREIAGYYGLELDTAVTTPSSSIDRQLDVVIRDEAHVQRVLAVEVTGVKNQESPAWLTEYLAHHGMNSINILVDLSNYVMLLTGHPSHLLDLSKLVRGQVVWELNREFDSITTLDGSVVELQKDEELIIRDSKNLLALAGVVGGSTAAVDLNTSDVFMEMAVYRSATIRKNSEKLKIVTEASRRLEKDLDPDDSELAFKLLYSLVLEHAGGTLSSRIFDYYPNPRKRERIAFDPAAPSAFAGIPIATETSLSILRNLGFIVVEEGGKYFATPPAGRTDIGIPQDLVEEVIRINGYDKIPSAELPSLTPVKDITPRHLRVADVCKDLLAALGYDEALSLAMSRIGDNAETNYLPWESITTLNSVNDLFPDLRQSLAAGMLNQLDTYLKRNVSHVRLFEVGKVFGKVGGSYQEHDALALLSVSDKSDLPRLRSDIERTIRNLGFSDVRYHAPKTIPVIANPHSCWDIFVADAHVGIIYKLVPNKAGSKNAYFAEVDLLQLSELSRAITTNPVVEITEKLVSLDANVELQKSAPLDDAIANYHSRLPDENVWSIEVVDAFPLETTVRYTLRVTYTKLGDQQAKEIHLKAFDLVG